MWKNSLQKSGKMIKNGGRFEKIHRSVNRHTHLHSSHNIIFQQQRDPT